MVVIKQLLNMNLIGTFEGYVPTAADLYLRGQNIANFTRYMNYGFPVFDAGQLTLTAENEQHAMQANFSLIGYSRLNFELYKTGWLGSSPYHSIAIQNTSGNLSASVDLDSALNVQQTVSIDISALNISGNMAITFMRWKGYIYRIWLS